MAETKDWQYQKKTGEWVDCTKGQAVGWKKKGYTVRKKPTDESETKKDNSDFNTWKNEHSETDNWEIYSGNEICDKYWDTTRYKRDYKYNSADKKTYCAIKFIGGKVTPSPETSPGASGYKECTDFYQINCKDAGSAIGRPNTNGAIYKVQGCIGVKQDSFFGPRTEGALQAKIGKNYFTEDQVEVICNGEVPGGTSPAIVMPLTQEQKEQYWNDLIEKERIYDQGLIHTLKNGAVVYVVKTDINNPSVKTPLSSLKDVDLTANDFIVMYPINKGEPRGKFGLLAKYKTPSGEEKVKIETNPRWYWTPEEEVESIDMFESKIKDILKSVLSEQTFSGRMTNTQPGTQTTPNVGTSQVTTTVNKPDPKVVQNTIDPIKEETISLLTSIQNMNTFKLAASQKDKSDLNDAITQLKNFDSSKACEGENVNLIDDNLILINNIIRQNQDKFGAGDIITKLKSVKANLEKVKRECGRLNTAVNSQTTTTNSQTTPSGTPPQATTPSGTPPQATTQSSGTQPGQTQEEPKELDSTQCRDLVLQYLYGAITSSNMENVGGAMAKTKILDKTVIKNRLCGCYKLGDLNDVEINKSDFTSGNYRLNPNFLNFRFGNKNLKWSEIVKLVRTGKNKGFEIGRGYVDDSFGVKERCIGQINESLKTNVKSHISEAINKKKTLTESIVNKITKKIG